VVRNVHGRTACETYTDFVRLPLGDIFRGFYDHFDQVESCLLDIRAAEAQERAVELPYAVIPKGLICAYSTPLLCSFKLIWDS
jgi:hypothetical protein